MRRHTRGALVTGVQTCALPIYRAHVSPAAIAGISEHLLQLLERFAQSALRNLGEIALAGAEEQARQQAANHPQPYPTDIAVHQRIAHLAALNPHSTAVIFDGQRFSYGDIERRANQLAHALMAHGVGPETRVGVALPRSEGVIVALLAVLKAGGAYVPLDTGYPRERLAYLIEDSGLALLLTRSEEHTSELQSLMRISSAVFCLKQKNTNR